MIVASAARVVARPTHLSRGEGLSARPRLAGRAALCGPSWHGRHEAIR
jgi:hypothetical protein